MAAVATNAHGTPDSCGSCANSRKCALGSRTDSASVQCLMLGETSFNVPGGGGGGDAPVSQLLGLSTGEAVRTSD